MLPTLVGFEPVAADQFSSARGQVRQFRHFAVQGVMHVGFRAAEDRGYLFARQNFRHVLHDLLCPVRRDVNRA